MTRRIPKLVKTLPIKKINLDKAGVIWGAGIGGLETFQNEMLNFADNDRKPRFNPFFIPSSRKLPINRISSCDW